MTDIVTLTLNPCIDRSTAVGHVVPDRKLRCEAPKLEPGGGGVNVARAIRRLGGDALAVYPAGGPAGELLQSLLAEEGVPQLPVPISAWTRENLNVSEEATGNQFRFVFPGPDLTAAEWQACLDAIARLRPSPAYLVASGSLPPGAPRDFYARVAREARRTGTRMVLDTSGDAAGPALQEGVFLVKPSLREFQVLTGRADAEEPHLVEEAAARIAAGACEALVLSLGSGGVLVVTSSGPERIPAPTVRVRSTVGAGDALLAGIVLELQRGRSLGEAARYGVAAAAAAVMNPGTQLCRRDDTERIYAGLRREPA